jgi:hypothetical protein
MTEVYTLQSSEAIARWDELAPLLARLPQTATTPLSHVRDMVEKAEAQVWCIGTPVECVLITKIENSMEQRYGLAWVAAGDMRLFTELKPIVESWFREAGCQEAAFIGRRGWKKYFTEYTEQSVHMVKKL